MGGSGSGRKKSNYVRLHLWVSKECKEFLKRLAKSNKTSIGKIIMQLLGE